MKNLKICFIGLGSIGKKHLNNLTAILKDRDIKFTIDALRSKDTPLEEGVKSYIRNEYIHAEDLDSDYDIIFITNPTSKHAETLQDVMGKTSCIFMEKPLFAQMGYDKLIRAADNLKCHVASPLRFHPVIKALKELLKKEKVYAMRVISSSYLPDWRKGSDYRNIYSAKKELGGGVCLDLIHEWDYIIDLFGFPKKTHLIKGHYSVLEINSEDIGLYIGEYEDKIIEIHLDYFGKFPMRQLETFCENCVIFANLLENEIIIQSEGKTETIQIEASDMYWDEMNVFIEGVLGKKEMVNDMNHAYQTLRIALGES